MTLHPIKILLIDDSESDVFLTKRVFEKENITNKIYAACDGEEAAKILQQDLIDNDLPDVILLDINMPKMDGKHILSFIKSSKDFKHISVIMLSSSQLETDVLNTYKMDADGYIVKPIDINAFYEIIRKVDYFKYTISKVIND